MVEAETATRSARCPSCRVQTSKIHDRYIRRPLDLPWRGHPTRLMVRVCRFRCLNVRCKRRTFAEDCGPNLPRYARLTLQASDYLLRVALTAGGEAGARLANKGGLPTSPDTLLRLVRRLPVPLAATTCILGIDDLALRRRQVYATIFIDLETHRPIDIVEGREANTLALWLKAHPGIKVIARDRSGAYADGARAGAPQAVQVADRFHLVQNASAALDGMLRGRRLSIKEETEPMSIAADPAPMPRPEPAVPSALSPTKQYQSERRASRIARWERVRALAQAGATIRQIGREIGISRKTVRRLIAAPEPPRNRVENRRPGGLRSPTLQPYVTCLQDRWQAGCTNVSQLFREIAAQGYAGSRSLLVQALQAWRSPRLPRKEQRQMRRLTHRLSMRWLCLRPLERLKPEERSLLDTLLAQDDDLALGHQLLQEFRRVIAERSIAGLDNWLQSAKSSNLPTFVALANGINADRAAVDAALTMPWSNGPAEGHINRVKLIKRQGYGRAKLDLLRARVLAA